MHNDDLTKIETQDVIENNKYLARKSVDVSTILVDGEIPKFERNVDTMMCVLDVALFVRKNGISNHKNLAKYLESLENNQIVFFSRRLQLDQMETMLSNKIYANIVKRVMKVIV